MGDLRVIFRDNQGWVKPALSRLREHREVDSDSLLIRNLIREAHQAAGLESVPPELDWCYKYQRGDLNEEPIGRNR